MQTQHDLLDAQDSVLVVIDIQDKFLSRLKPADAERVVAYSAWLIKVANWLSIPVVVTAEEVTVMGKTTATLLDCLSEDTVEYDKMVFGLAGQPDILAALDKTTRRTAVLVGLETDVCVAQSALGLLQHGYRVAVAADACASPQEGHAYGLQRMCDAGVTTTSTKGLFFEWVRDLQCCHDFFRNSGIVAPEGLYIG